MSSDLGLERARVRGLAARIPFPGAVAAYVAVRVTTLLAVAVGNLSTHHGLVADLSTWDGAWFLRAVEHGWPRHLPMIDGHVAGNPIAFFPLFPLLLRVLSAATGLSPDVLGLVVSALAGLAAVIAVGALTRRYSDEAGARRAALLFALSPGSFVFSLIYNEGLLLTLAALGLAALMSRRWLVAGLLGAVATFTSPVGLVFFACCVWSAGSALRRRREWRALIAPALAPTGFVAWMAYLWVHTGNPRAWQLTERGGWNSYPSLLYPVRVIGKFVTNPISPTMTGQMLVAGTVVSVGLLVLAYRDHLPTELLIYATVAVALFAVSAPVGLRPRFVMLAFPLTMVAGTHWRGRRFHVVLALSTVLLALMTIETLTSWAVFP